VSADALFQSVGLLASTCGCAAAAAAAAASAAAWIGARIVCSAPREKTRSCILGLLWTVFNVTLRESQLDNSICLLTSRRKALSVHHMSVCRAVQDLEVQLSSWRRHLENMKCLRVAVFDDEETRSETKYLKSTHRAFLIQAKTFAVLILLYKKRQI
jgi:hypothetical protein